MSINSPLTPLTTDWGPISDAQRKLRNCVTDNFFTGFDKQWLLAPLQASVEALPTLYKPIGEAYVKNLAALIAVVALPITFASNRASDWRFQQILMAERIRQLPDRIESEASETDSGLTSEGEQEALRIAR